MNRADLYRYAEHCMYSYKRNVKRLRELRAELEAIRESGDVRGQSYETHGRSNSISKSVEGLIEEIEKYEYRLSRIEREVNPVLRLLEGLKTSEDSQPREHEIIVLREYYFANKPAVEVMRQYDIPRRKLYAMRRELVQRVIKLSKRER